MVITSWLAALSSKLFGKKHTPRTRSQQSKLAAQASQASEVLEERTLMTVNPVIDIYDPNNSVIDEDHTFNVNAPGVLANDPAGVGALSTIQVTNTAVGVAVLNADGSFTYTPGASMQSLNHGELSIQEFTYKVSDAGDFSVGPTAIVRLYVTGLNDAPTATNATQSINYAEDGGLQSIGAIVADDADLHDTITATLSLSDGNAGVLSAPGATFNLGVLSITGQKATVNAALADVKFTPNPDYDKDFTINVSIADGGEDGAVPYTGVITMTANPVNNDAPTANGDTLTVDEDSSGNTGTLTGSDLDTNPASPPDYAIVGFAAHGTVNITDSATGDYTYTPDPDYFGSDSFTFQITDSTTLTSNIATINITVTSINDVPVFTVGIDQTVLEDAGAQSVSNFATGISAGAANESGQTVNFIVTNDNNSLFSVQPSIDATGKLTYTPAANQNGSATVTVQIHDNGGTANGGVDTSSTQTFLINVTAVNDVPTFTVGATQTTLEDAGAQSVTGFISTFAAGPTNESSQIIDFVVTNDNNSLFSVQPTIDANGNLTYTAAANENGSATVTVYIHDDGSTLNGGVDASATQTFTINVTAVNDAPSFTKGGDESVDEDTGLHTVNGWATSLVKGPANESAQTLSFGITTDNDALFSSLPVVDSSGNLTYTLAANRFGTAVVTVTLHDNGGTANGGSDSSAPQTFSIVVANINDAPSFTVGPTQTTNEDAGAQSVTGFISTFSPGPFESDTIDFVVTNDNNGLFSVQPAIDATGKLTYTAAADANGSATVTVYIHDDGGTANGGVDQSSTQTFTLNINAVNDAPTFTKGADESVLEDTGAHTVTGWATGMSTGPANESGQTLTAFHVTTNNDSLFSVLPAIDPMSGDLTYTLAANAYGTAVVTVTLSDDGGSANGGSDTSAPQTFNINVTGINDAPSFTVGPTQTTDEDAGAQSVSDFIPTFSPGPLEFDNVNFVVTNDNNGLFSVQPAIDATGKLTYTAAPNANGTATVTVYIHDDGGTANSGVDQSATQMFTLNITAVNDAPTFTKGADEAVLEDTGLHTVNGWATGITKGPTVDENTQVLTFNVSTNNNALFSVLPAIDSSGNLTYTLAANAFGTATVTVTLSDDGGTANGGVDTSASQTFDIVVTNVNDAPSFTKGADESVFEDTNPHSVANWATAISAGPGEGSQMVTFNVTNNDNPTLFSVAPAIAADGTLTYTLAPNANGTANITITLSDDGNTANGGDDTSASQTFAIVVNPVNDAPAFTKGADEAVLEDTGLHTVNGWATGITKGPTADENTQVLTFNVSTNNNALFSVLPAIDSSGNLTYTLAANAFGTATVTVTLSDDGGTLNGGVDTSASQTFDIVVTNVNDAPSFTKGADESVFEDTNPHSVANWATAISAGPGEGSQMVTFNVTNNDNPSLFSVAPAIAADGTLTYTLAPNANGTANITITLSDDGSTANGGVDTSASQTFAIVVNPVNDAPAFTKGADQPVLEDTGLHTVNGWATGITKGPTADENTQVLTFNVSTNNNALFSVLPAIDSSGNLTYTLAANAFGTATVTVTLSDDGGTLNGGVDTSASQTFDIVVTNVNDVPSFTKGADETVFEDTNPHSVANWATAISAGPGEGSQTLTFNVTNNDNPTLFSVAPAIAADGTLTYTLAPNANGTAMITITLSDNGGTADSGIDTSGSQTFAINVIGVNDAPAFTKGADEDVLEDSGVAGAHTVNNWATDITKGPTADENSQTLTFLVDNDNHSLFAVQPAIDASGNLTYTLNPNAFGSATVTVTLMDNGGTLDGGVNTSAPQSFDIVVTRVNDAPTFTAGPNQTVDEDSLSSPTNLITNGGFEGGLSGWTAVGTDADGPSQNDFYSQTGTTNPLASGPMNTFNVSGPPEGSDAAMSDQVEAGSSILYQDFVVPSDIVTATLSLQLYINNHNIDFSDPLAINDFDFGNQQARIDILKSTAAVDSTEPSDVLMNLFQTQPGSAPEFGYSTLTADLTTFLQAHTGETLRLRIATSNTADFFEVGVDDVQLNVTHPAAHTVANWATDISTGGSGESQTLTFDVANDNNALFSVQPAIDPVTGDLTYTLAPNANGVATVSVVLRDDGGTLHGGVDASTPQTFTITVNPVNDAPVFNTPLYTAALEDTGAHTVAGFATGMAAGPASATDESGQGLSFSVVNDNNDLFTVQPSIDPVTGDLTYTLAPNAHGNATVNVALMDDGGTAFGGHAVSNRTFTIIAVDVNDAPTFSLPVDPDQTIQEDAGPQTVIGFATDISAGPDESDQEALFGILTSDDSKFAVLPHIDATTGNLMYTPADNATGDVLISVALLDDGGTDFGGVDMSTIQTFTIHITPVNDPPVAADETGIVVFEDGSRDILVLRDATEVDGDPLVITIATDPTHGVATVDDNGTPNDPTDDVINYQPFADYNGPDTFTYTLTDPLGLFSTATITMNVISLNDEPTFTLGSNPTVSEDDGAQTINGFITAFSPGPADESGQTVDFIVTNDNNSLFTVQPSIDASGNLTFTPAANQYGTATVTVYAHDDGPTDQGETATSAPQTFTITLTPVNDLPTFTVGGNQTVAEDAGAQTVSGFISSFSPGPNESSQTVDFIVTNDNNSLFSVQPTIAADGTLTYTPAANQNGTATVSVQIHDNGGGTDTSVVQTFTITVTAVNDVPTFTVGGNQTTAEDAGAQTVSGFISTFSPGPNESSQTVDFIVSNDNNALFSVQPAIAADGTLTYTAAPNQNGSATVTVQIHDDAGGTDTSASQTFTITITAVNDVPTFTVGGNQTTAEDAGAQTVEDFISTFSPGPSNESGQTVDFIVTNDNNALFSVQPAIAADGTLTYTAAPNHNGTATVTVQIHDDAGGTDTSTTQTFTITVTPVADPPVIDDTTFSIAENSANNTVVGTLTETDPDVGDTKTFAITGGNTNGAFTINASTGQITVANGAALDFETTPTFHLTILVTDGGALTDTATVTINLTNVAEPPVLDLPSAPSTFYIRHGQTVIDAAAAITGQESPIDFRGGKLTVQVTSNANSNDRLAIYDQDAAAGKISVSGKNISYGSTVIGRITQTGSGSTALIITFNQAVTTDAINALLKVITYKSTSTTPPTAQRTISFRVENAANSASVSDTQLMNVSTSPPSRAITISGNPTAYTNGAAAVVIAPTAIVTGPSTLDFDGARISVQITTGSNSRNKLGISNVGGITLVGSDVLYNGNKIGRATIGSNSLSVRLESINATPEAVQALTRAINFSTLASNTSLADRVATFRLTDVSGATSTGATQTITVGANT